MQSYWAETKKNMKIGWVSENPDDSNLQNKNDHPFHSMCKFLNQKYFQYQNQEKLKKLWSCSQLEVYAYLQNVYHLS